MHDSVLRFLVGSQPRQNLARADIHFRQSAEAQNGVGNPTGGNAVSAPYAECDVIGCNHAPRHGFPVQHAAIAGFGFESVSDGVAQIQDAAQSSFALVG